MSGVTLDRADAVLTITIDRPQVGNALDLTTMETIGDAICSAPDEGLRVIIITGAGERFFSTGVDIKAVVAAQAAGVSVLANIWGRARRSLFEIVAEADIPVIAAVNGAAVGGGFELMLACDFALASEGATFALPEAKRGMASHFASIVLPRRIAPVLATEMLLTGEPIDAVEALRRGLVVAVEPPDNLLAAARARAMAIAANAPLSIRRIRRTMRRSRELPLTAALRLDECPNPYDSEDRVEGFQAFIEKRAPIWRGQ